MPKCPRKSSGRPPEPLRTLIRPPGPASGKEFACDLPRRLDLRVVAQLMTSREIHWTIAGQDVTVRVEESEGHGTSHIAGRSLPFRLLQPNWIEIDGKPHRFHVRRAGN